VNLIARAQAEVVNRHHFFVEWFTGRASEADLEASLRAFAPDMVMIEPDANTIGRDDVVAMVSNARGKRPADFEIKVELISARLIGSGTVAVVYDEHQVIAGEKSPAVPLPCSVPIRKLPRGWSGGICRKPGLRHNKAGERGPITRRTRMKMIRKSGLALAMLCASALSSQACDITIGMVMELTGPAGAYGQAGAKSVEMAFRDLNEAGGVLGCNLVTDTRDSQSQGNVAVDQATQLVNVKQVPVVIGGIISSVSIPILTSVTAAAGVVQVSPASSSPTLTQLSRDGKTGGYFFRTITSDALQGIAAAKYAIDSGLKKLAIIHVNNDFGVNLMREFSASYEALGGEITSATPYNENQPNYSAEVTAAMEGNPTRFT
jgi:hypothetical protein